MATEESKKSDFEFEIKFYENLFQERPDFVEALIALGDPYTKAGLYQKGLEIDLRLSQLRPDDGMVFYNLACSQSLLKNIEAALKALIAAIKLGYRDWEFMRQDPDLDNLRQDGRFQEILERIKD
jgi:tetratricopeptide (TPR) repeat protein